MTATDASAFITILSWGNTKINISWLDVDEISKCLIGRSEDTVIVISFH